MRPGDSNDCVHYVQSWLDRWRRRQTGGGYGRMAGLDRDPRLRSRCGPLRRNSHADPFRARARRPCHPSLAVSVGSRDCTMPTRGVPYGIALAAAGLLQYPKLIHLGGDRLSQRHPPTSTALRAALSPAEIHRPMAPPAAATSIVSSTIDQRSTISCHLSSVIPS